MEVTRENFVTTLPIVEEALKSCLFYAFDLEMSGKILSLHYLMLPRHRAPGE